jgi:hypothetical protein
MKKSFGIFLFIVLLLFRCNSFSQSVAKPYEVGTWQGFCSAAISYTFDDNCPNQLAIAVPMFNEFDFKLTLFTVTNPSWAWPANWSGLQNASSQGHEIASHTVTHAHITGMSDSVQVNEFQNSQDVINSHITGMQCVTMAYPYCETGNNSIVLQYYFAARGCSGQVETKTPGNFMNISSMICGSQGLNTVAALKSKDNSAVASKGWCVYLIHGINGTESGAYSPLSADTMRASLEYLKANPDKFWVSSFGNVAKYIRERNSASVSEISTKEDSITVAVSDTMDNSYYNCPITVRRPLPQGWTSSGVMQNGKNVDSKIVVIDTVKYIMFNVIPDNGNIVLIKNGATGVEQGSVIGPNSPFMLYQNYPNPFNPSTMISYYVPQNQNVEIKVFDIIGNEITTLVEGFKSAGFHSVEFTRGNLSSGTYFYRLKAGNTILTKKIILLQ